MHATFFNRDSVVSIFCSENGDKNYNRKERLPVAINTCNKRETLKRVYL